MKRVLITGMSGTGKSSVVHELVRRGHRAVDTDDGWCMPLPDGRQEWDVPAIAGLLDDDRWPVLFLAGCEENQRLFHDRFDHIVLLSAPEDVLLERIGSRTTNDFGKDPEERRRILADLRTVEPLLRAVADHEEDTTAPLADVVARILATVDA